MLVDELPVNFFAQDKMTAGYLKINKYIATITNRFAHGRYQLTRVRKMFKYMTTNNQVCRFVHVFFGIIIGNKANVARNIVARPRLIARTEGDANVVSATAYNAQKLALSASNLDNVFRMQVIFCN